MDPFRLMYCLIKAQRLLGTGKVIFWLAQDFNEINLNIFFSRGIFIFILFAQNWTAVLSMKAGGYVGQTLDQTEGGGCGRK